MPSICLPLQSDFQLDTPHPIPPTRGAYIDDEVDILSLFPMIINYLDLSFLLFWISLLYVYVFSNILSNSRPNWCQYSMKL